MRLLLSALASASLTPPLTALASPAVPSPSTIAVAPQYDTSHVYVEPEEVNHFVQSFTATFGGQSTKQVVVQVTPTPSATTSQLIQTPVGTVSLFGFRTGIPYPFGAERTGYLVTDIDQAVRSAKEAGADVLVSTFPDPIGRDALVRFPGGLGMQLYWHTVTPDYRPFQTVPESRVYVSPERADALAQSFIRFSHGMVTSDDTKAAADEIGLPGTTHRRIRIESGFGKMTILVTDGHLPYPFGRETTGYEVADLDATLAKGKAAGVDLLVKPMTLADRRSAMVSFPGGYVAEIHALLHQ